MCGFSGSQSIDRTCPLRSWRGALKEPSFSVTTPFAGPAAAVGVCVQSSRRLRKQLLEDQRPALFAVAWTQRPDDASWGDNLYVDMKRFFDVATSNRALLVARLAAEKSPGWEQAGVSFDQMVGDFLEGTLLPSLEQAMAEPEEDATEGGRSSPAERGSELARAGSSGRRCSPRSCTH